MVLLETMDKIMNDRFLSGCRPGSSSAFGLPGDALMAMRSRVTAICFGRSQGRASDLNCNMGPAATGTRYIIVSKSGTAVRG